MPTPSYLQLGNNSDPTKNLVLRNNDDGSADIGFGNAPSPVVAQRIGGNALLNKNAAYTLTAGDSESLINASGTWTLNHGVSASAVGPGFRYTIRNGGVGVITIDPVGTETIDGVTTLLCLSKQNFDVVSDGANWFTIGRATKVLLSKATTFVPNQMVFALPLGYTSFGMEWTLCNDVPGNSLGLRFANDGVPTFIGDNYYWAYEFSAAGQTPSAGAPLNSSYLGISHGALAPHSNRGFGLINPGGTGLFTADYPSGLFTNGVIGVGDGTNYIGQFTGYMSYAGRITHCQIFSVAGGTTNGYVELWGNA